MPISSGYNNAGYLLALVIPVFSAPYQHAYVYFSVSSVCTYCAKIDKIKQNKSIIFVWLQGTLIGPPRNRSPVPESTADRRWQQVPRRRRGPRRRSDGDEIATVRGSHRTTTKRRDGCSERNCVLRWWSESPSSQNDLTRNRIRMFRV